MPFFIILKLYEEKNLLVTFINIEFTNPLFVLLNKSLKKKVAL